MAEAPVEAIRQSSRYYLNISRKKLKDVEADGRRPMSQMKLADVNIAALSSKLKSKSGVTESDLKLLKNALIQDAESISMVLNAEGALRGLVRELTSNNVNRQVEAAGCLCNLALGDSRACVTITKAAAAYLIAALDSLTLELANVCAWTLGNLCGSGPAASALVCAGGAVGALCAMVGGGGGGRDRADAAVCALTLLAHARGDLLSKEHLDLMIKSVAYPELTSNIRLIFILSCHKDFSDPEELVQRVVIARFNDLMENHLMMCIGANCCDLKHLIRTLANMVGENIHVNFLRYMREDDTRIVRFKSLVEDPFLKSSMLWLFGNMMCIRRDFRKFITNFNNRVHAPPPAAAHSDEQDDIADYVEDVPEVIDVNRMEADEEDAEIEDAAADAAGNEDAGVEAGLEEGAAGLQEGVAEKVIGQNEVFAFQEQNGR